VSPKPFSIERINEMPNLSAFSAVTVLVLVSLAILYRGGLLEDVQSRLKTTFG
jgi:hypothetical protein